MFIASQVYFRNYAFKTFQKTTAEGRNLTFLIRSVTTVISGNVNLSVGWELAWNDASP